MAMNEKRVRELNPRTARLRKGIHPAAVTFDYNEHSDTLFVYVFPDDGPLISVPVEDGQVSLLISPDTGEVVGFQLDDFMGIVLPEHPSWLGIAQMAGIEQREIDNAMSRIEEEHYRSAVIMSAIRDLIDETRISA